MDKVVERGRLLKIFFALVLSVACFMGCSFGIGAEEVPKERLMAAIEQYCLKMPEPPEFQWDSMAVPMRGRGGAKVVLCTMDGTRQYNFVLTFTKGKRYTTVDINAVEVFSLSRAGTVKLGNLSDETFRTEYAKAFPFTESIHESIALIWLGGADEAQALEKRRTFEISYWGGTGNYTTYNDTSGCDLIGIIPKYHNMRFELYEIRYGPDSHAKDGAILATFSGDEPFYVQTLCIRGGYIGLGLRCYMREREIMSLSFDEGLYQCLTGASEGICIY